jgi:hypothetical protein
LERTESGVNVYLGAPQTNTNIVFKAGDNFSVDKDGNLYANNGNFTGTINATGGTIGGWDISENALSKGNNAIYLGNPTSFTIAGKARSNIVFKAGGNFGVDSSGKLYATDGYFANANITNGGSVGGWAPSTEGLQITDSSNNILLYLGTTEKDFTVNSSTTYKDIVFKAGNNFHVDKDGKLYATDGEFTGTITANGGNIAGWTIKNITSGGDKESSITFSTPGSSGGFGMYTYYPDAANKKVTIGNSGAVSNWRLLIGNNFGVNSSGILYCTDVNITGGSQTIGGNFSVSETGILRASEAIIGGTITATGGKIGPFQLDADGLKYTGQNNQEFEITNAGFKLTSQNTTLGMSGSGYTIADNSNRVRNYLTYEGLQMRMFKTNSDFLMGASPNQEIKFHANGITFSSTVID